MVQVLQPQNRRPSFGERLTQGVGRGLDIGSKLMEQHQQEQKLAQDEQLKSQQFQQENEAVNKLIGKDISGIRDPHIRQKFVDMALQGQNQEQKFGFDTQLEDQKSRIKSEDQATKLSGEKQDKVTTLKSALESVNQMKQLRKKGNLGLGTKLWSNFGGETAKDKGAYETLGNSLIQFATNIPIRNKAEFEKLVGHISDPEITDKEAEGILDKLDKIITDSLSQYDEVGGSNEPSQPKQNNKERPPLSSFQR